jgi:hypothetical protein
MMAESIGQAAAVTKINDFLFSLALCDNTSSAKQKGKHKE